LPDDDIGAARHIERALKKYDVADLEFVNGHGTQPLDESNDSSLVPAGNCNVAQSKAAGHAKTDGSA
jgi:hypothetical protein